MTALVRYPKWPNIAIAGIAGCSLFACSDPSDTGSNSQRPRELEIAAHAEPAGKLFRIVGTTNLPDGTQMMVHVNRPHGRLLGESDVVVAQGRFASEAFSLHGGRPYKPGSYTVSVSASLADLQPPEVKDVIGPDYRNFFGKYVDRSDMGSSVDYTTTVRIGG